MSAEDALFDYVIESCLVVEDNVFAFFASLDPALTDEAKVANLSPCRIVHYFALEDRWEWTDIRRKGIYATSVGFSHDKTRETVFALSLNEVISVTYADEPKFIETKIPLSVIGVVENMKFIGDHLFAVSSKTKIVRRDKQDEWRQIYKETNGVEVRLFAIDGYGEDDIYVTGKDKEGRQHGILHFDGKKITRQQVPAALEEEGFFGIAVCCTPDGTVYAVDRSGALIAGSKDERWRTLIHTDIVETNYMRDMVWFKGELYATSPDWLYRFDGSNWEPINPDTGFKPIAWGFVSANENVLLAAGPFGASVFDGTEWKSIYSQVTIEDLAMKDALDKQLSAVESVLDIFGGGKGRD